MNETTFRVCAAIGCLLVGWIICLTCCGDAEASPTGYGPAGIPDPFTIDIDADNVEGDTLTAVEVIAADSAHATIDSTDTDHLVVNATADLGPSVSVDSGGVVTAEDVSFDSLAYFPSGISLCDDDSLRIYSDKFNFYIEQDQSLGAGDRDIAIIAKEEDSGLHSITFDDGLGGWKFSDNLIYGIYGFYTSNNMTLNPDYVGTGASLKGTLYLGGNEGDVVNVRESDTLDIACPVVLPNDQEGLSDTLVTAGGDSIFVSAGIVWKWVPAP